MTGPPVKFEVIGADKYQAAVQNPGRHFADPMLQNAKVETKRGGLPKFRTGGFAVVYKVTTRENPQHAEKSYALRCYKHLAPDLAMRYARISEHLSTWSVKSEFLIRTDYHATGVRIGNEWKPITTMQWIEGDFLDVFLDRASNQPHLMAWLVSRLGRLERDLRRAGMAHGDLHHKNLLITRQQKPSLVLIDYDGMYVPALKGSVSNETGQPDYQHPGRDGSHFDSGLDRFSLAVLYLNAVAVQRHPELWDSKGRTEGLLTSASDYASPDESPVLDRMASYPDLRAAVVRFRRMCLGDIDDVLDPREFFASFDELPSPEVAVPPMPTRTGHERAPVTSATPLCGTSLRELRAHAGNEVTVIGRYERYEKGDGTAASAYRTLHLQATDGATFEIMVEEDVARQFKETGRPWKVNRSDWLSVTGVLLNDKRRFVIDLEQAADLEKLTSSGAQRRLRRLIPRDRGDQPPASAGAHHPPRGPKPDPARAHEDVMSMLRGQEPSS